MRRSIDEIRGINKYYQDLERVVEVQLANERNGYVWQNMSNIFRTGEILRDGEIVPLEKSIMPEIEETVFRAAPDWEEMCVGDFFKRSSMDALLVIKGGIIVHEEYKGMRERDKHNWFSVGKTVSSTLIALLAEEGRVDGEDSVSDYIPELKGSECDRVRIEEVMDMATGLDSTEHEDEGARLNPDSGWYRWAVSIGLFHNKDTAAEGLYDVLRNMKRVRPANEVFEYNSINTFILELIVENVEDKPLNEVLSERIWSRAGMQNDAYVAVTRDGNSMGFGFISSTLRDLGRYGMIFTPSIEKLCRERIVSGEIVGAIQRGGRKEVYRKGAVGRIIGDAFHEDEGISNRYQWDAVFSDGDFYKGGVGGQGLYVSPGSDLVIAWFASGTEHHEEAMARAIAKTLKKIKQREN